jgi:alanine racemase
VVKANAYGHGAVECSRSLADVDATWLAVTDASEGIAVRSASPDTEILVMGGLWSGEAEAALAHRLVPVVWEETHVREAARPGASMTVHLEIDTGMSRQGVRLEDLPAFLDLLQARPTLRFDGVMTHFHSPEMRESKATAEQAARFAGALDTIFARGFRPAWIHAGNSASLLEPGVNHLVELATKHGAKAMLRPGLALYGYAPRFTGGAQPADAHELKPVLTWKTRVASLRWIEPGEIAGYCATFRAARRTRLALLPVGYADGLNRLLSNKGTVLIRGQRAPIAGRISMDLTIVDVTDIAGIELGDEAVLIGQQGAERITAYDHAVIAGTIPYEILCNIHARVPREMVE